VENSAERTQFIIFHIRKSINHPVWVSCFYFAFARAVIFIPALSVAEFADFLCGSPTSELCSSLFVSPHRKNW